MGKLKIVEELVFRGLIYGWVTGRWGSMAGFIVSSLQGAILVAKSQRSPIPVERFRRVLFQRLLPRGTQAAKRRSRRVGR